MNRQFVIDRKYAFRSIILLGLLLGLFVSSGEGVRLFPLPSSHSERGDTVSPELSVSASENYNFAVHRFRNASKIVKSKIAKRSAIEQSAAVALPEGFELITVARLESELGSGAPLSFQLLISHSVPPGRAPPAV